MPDSGLFPTDAFRRVLNRVIREEGRELLQYYPAARLSAAPRVPGRLPAALRARGAPRGDPDRQRLAAGLRPGRAHPARSRRLRRDRAAVLSARHAGVPRLRGPAPARAHAGRRARSPSTSSGCSSGSRRSSSTASRAPTIPPGSRMRPEARQRLLEVAARHRLPIVEDGFDGSLFFGRRPPGAAQGARRLGARHLHRDLLQDPVPRDCASAGSWPRPELIDRLEMAKHLADIHTSPLIQAAVYHFCRQRLLDRHQARVAARVRRGGATRCWPRSPAACRPG